MRRPFLVSALAALVTLFCSPIALAQVATGTLVGTSR